MWLWVRGLGIATAPQELWNSPLEAPWGECSSILQRAAVEQTLLPRQGNKAGLGCAALAFP